MTRPYSPFFFFLNDTATTEIYTLSLHDALPISLAGEPHGLREPQSPLALAARASGDRLEIKARPARSEEHTSELQSRSDLVCRLLLEKKKPASCGPDRSDSPYYCTRTPMQRTRS